MLRNRGVLFWLFIIAARGRSARRIMAVNITAFLFIDFRLFLNEFKYFADLS